MGTAYMLTSAGCFLVEIALQIAVITIHSDDSEVLFIILLALLLGPLLFINFVSAIQVTRTQDFTGKSCGRAICIVFHSLQFGIVWRSLKLLILYDSKDWLDYLHMRLFHCGFQSIPFSVILTYSMFVHNTADAVHIMTVIVSMISASVALTTFRTGNTLYAAEEFEDSKQKVRRIIGVVMLVLSTFLVLISRCGSIVLFSVLQPFWIALPLALHFIFHMAVRLYHLNFSGDQVLIKITKGIYLSFVSIFDIVGKGYTGVKCSYVLYYTAMLLENLVFSFYWMLTSDLSDRFKLLSVVLVILCFIVGLIMKFSSCGCIYNIESDILSDAFNNPELKKELGLDKDTTLIVDQHITHAIDDPDGTLNDLRIVNSRIVELQGPNVGAKKKVLSKRSKRSKYPKHPKPGSSSTSSDRHVVHPGFDNSAFIHSQGNISIKSETSSSSHKRSRGSHNRSHGSHNRSNNSRTLSRSSGHNSQDDPKQLPEKEADIYDRHEHVCEIHRHSRENSKSSQLTLVADNTHYIPDQSAPHHIDNTEHRLNTEDIDRANIKVSDRSIYENPKRTQLQHMGMKSKGSYAEIGSSNSRYSRNTNTLNSTLNNGRRNGFDDPFRERNQRANIDRSRRRQLNENGGHYADSVYSDLDYSLNSSELYPSLSSDTSSMMSHSTASNRRWNTRHKVRSKTKNVWSRDGYSTDVSNSDYLSSFDHSMEDSSSWTGSTESDGAVTWPPSHTSNLLNMYNIPDKVSSKDNVMHWLDAMDPEESEHDRSFSTLNEPSLASDTDMSMSGMQKFEVKKSNDRKRFKRLIPKPKGMLLKFRSLTYKNKEKHLRDRPYPLQQSNSKKISGYIDQIHKDQSARGDLSILNAKDGRLPLPSVPLPVDSVQESIV